ncbi:MAG: YggS family pyridoxal phosphate-dependent enzyme, partial [Gemmataceae bacterium]
VTPTQQKLSANLQAVEERLRAACARAGRDRAEVTLVAVTKSTTVAIARLLPALGVADLAESRPQELWHKAEALAGQTVRWHQIGHLQRNKVERTLPLVQLIHSVDSWRLLAAIEQECARSGRASVPVLLEVNVSREAQKHGLSPEDLSELPARLTPLQHVRVHGLMTMAAQVDDVGACRPTFRELRELREHWRGQLPPPHDLAQLSMGMSGDFEIAVEEGATLVRLGSILFEGLAGA